MLKKYLQGIEDASPALVGLARGAVEVGVLAGLAFVGLQLDDVLKLIPHLSPGNMAIGLSAGAWAIRWLEGLADQVIDPTQNRLRTP